MPEAVEVDGPQCPATTDNPELRCTKVRQQMPEGDWIHGGGHFFATVETNRILRDEHYDATALLSGLPTSHHRPEDCDGTGFCAWRGVVVE